MRILVKTLTDKPITLRSSSSPTILVTSSRPRCSSTTACLLLVLLSWGLRVNIILGVTFALSYLHEEHERQMIHKDVKTCNVMLDDEFNAKLGDFGLAEVYDHSDAAREATILVGTIGYLAPEYVYWDVPSVKSDVYTFGVVVIEVATGRRHVADDGSVLVNGVWGLWVKGQLLEASDSRLAGRYNVVEIERVLMVGLYPNHKRRPTIKEAVRVKHHCD